MEHASRILLFIAGIINLLPSILAFLPSKISKSYGIEVPNINYELLLRHRAVLFGIIGGLLIYSAITRKYFELSVLVGFISMVSFIALYFLAGKEVNAELTKVMKIDIIGIVALSASFILHLIKTK